MPAIPHMVLLAVLRRWSAGTGTAENHGKGTQYDHEIKPQRAMLQVIKIILQLRAHLVGRVRIALVDLRPAGHARPHDAAQGKVLDFPHIALLQRGRFRSRPDPAHVAAQDVEELRQLVEAAPAQKAADSGDARVEGSPETGA